MSMNPQARDDWFSMLTGFSEPSPDEVRDRIEVQGDRLTSKLNGQSYQCGRLEIPSLGELRDATVSLARSNAALKLYALVLAIYSGTEIWMSELSAFDR